MLQEKSAEIDANLAVTAQTWYSRAKDIDRSIQKEQEILLSDAAKTDRSENAVYQIASDNYARLQVSKRDIDNKIEAYERYNREYVPSEYITIGTTVKLKILSENGQTPSRGQRVFYIKIVPSDLGVARIGAITENSAVGKAIRGKYNGDTFKVHTRKGEIEYLIEEVY